MLPEAKNEDLMYVSGDKGKLVGDLQGFALPHGICSDSNGNVFVPDTNRSRIIEYAHGHRDPINTLSDGYYYPVDCAIDPTTGDLAVANFMGIGSSASGNIAIYPKASGDPKRYYDANIYYYTFCSYDPHGNLFIDGENFGSGLPRYAQLLSGAHTFADIAIPKVAQGYPLLWDGKHFAIETLDANSQATIYRIRISGSTGRIAGTTALTNWKVHQTVQFWVGSNTLIQPSDLAQPPSAKKLAIWNYPAGGNPIKVLHGFSTQRGPLFGVTISCATTPANGSATVRRESADRPVQ